MKPSGTDSILPLCRTISKRVIWDGIQWEKIEKSENDRVKETSDDTIMSVCKEKIMRTVWNAIKDGVQNWWEIDDKDDPINLWIFWVGKA